MSRSIANLPGSVYRPFARLRGQSQNIATISLPPVSPDNIGVPNHQTYFLNVYPMILRQGHQLHILLHYLHQSDEHYCGHQKDTMTVGPCQLIYHLPQGMVTEAD